MEREIITYDELIKLIIEAQKGNLEAQDFLITNNMGLVKSVAKRFLNRGCDFEDLCQIGCIGLLKAIKNFDVSYEVKLSTYAIPMIMGEIKRFLRDDGMIKVSRKMKENNQRICYMKEKYEKAYGCEPSLSEIAAELNIDQEDLVMALDSSYKVQYIYDSAYKEGEDEVLIIDKLHQDDRMSTNFLDELTIKEGLKHLNQIEKRIIELRYFNDLTQTNISKLLNISQVQVSRIEKKALSRLKEELCT